MLYIIQNDGKIYNGQNTHTTRAEGASYRNIVSGCDEGGGGKYQKIRRKTKWQ